VNSMSFSVDTWFVRLPWLLAFGFVCGAASCGGSGGTAEHSTVNGARPVLITAASEEGPAASGRWLAWMQSAGINPSPPRSTTDVFVRSGRRTFRVNPRGTHALTGGIDGRTLVLQITQGGRSRLARYNLATRRLRYLPSFVNDGSWLWRPDIDGHRILYGAIVPGRAQILAYEIRIANLRSGSVRVLLRLDGHANYAAPGQLRGNWATWVSCPDNVCNVWRENLATGRAESAPDPSYVSHSQFGPAVDRRGVVYFGRALASCGGGEIRRWDGRHNSLVLRLPADVAFQYSYLAKDAVTLYYDLVGCTRTARSDIYSVNVAGKRRRVEGQPAP
jgi:hypothetical protein